MTAGMQCDNCRRFGPAHAPGWLYVVREPGMSSPYAGLVAALSGTAETSEPATLCSARCLTEWAYLRAVADEIPAGVEPPPLPRKRRLPRPEKGPQP